MFLKEPGYAETNWHSDLRMAPLDTNAFVTAWIPLRPVSGAEGDSGLLFAVASHRDFALPFWHDLTGRGLEDRGYKLQDTGRKWWCLLLLAGLPRLSSPAGGLCGMPLACGGDAYRQQCRQQTVVGCSLCHTCQECSVGARLPAVLRRQIVNSTKSHTFDQQPGD